MAKAKRKTRKKTAVKAKKKRNYKREYATYHSKPEQKKRRAQRNASRAQMVKAGKAKKGDGKDVHHKDGNTANKSSKNLSVTTKKYNRSNKTRKPNK